MDRSRLEIVPASPAAPPAADLIGELDRLLDDLYHPDDNHFRLDAAEVAGEKGEFLVAYLDDRPVGCGGVRVLANGMAEVKRMYVRPGLQGQGIGRAILARLEAAARLRGATTLVLEMGDSQPAARRLYEEFGFAPIPCWGEYLATPRSVCLGKAL